MRAVQRVLRTLEPRRGDTLSVLIEGTTIEKQGQQMETGKRSLYPRRHHESAQSFQSPLAIGASAASHAWAGFPRQEHTTWLSPR